VFDDRLQPTRANLVSFFLSPVSAVMGFVPPPLIRLVASSCANFETWLRMRLPGTASRFFVSLAFFLILMSFG
jgi:hypothetical protein